jgi:hypothetical protein
MQSSSDGRCAVQPVRSGAVRTPERLGSSAFSGTGTGTGPEKSRNVTVPLSSVPFSFVTILFCLQLRDVYIRLPETDASLSRPQCPTRQLQSCHSTH